jgi:hypothetical protein
MVGGVDRVVDIQGRFDHDWCRESEGLDRSAEPNLDAWQAIVGKNELDVVEGIDEEGRVLVSTVTLLRIRLKTHPDAWPYGEMVVPNGSDVRLQ